MNYIEKLYNRSWSGRLNQNLKGDSRIHLEMLVDIIPPCTRLLDIGCGDGYLATLIQGKCQKLFGVDISDTALFKARARGYSQIDKLDLNEEKLPYADNYFEVITCMDLLEHIFDPEALLKEIHRIIKPKGILIVSTLNLRYLKYILLLIFDGQAPLTSGDPFLYDGGHCHYFTNKNLTALLNKCGFKVTWRKGVIPSPRLRFLLPFSRISLILEWLSPSLIIRGVKI